VQYNKQKDRLSPSTILIVDDEPPVREVVRAALAGLPLRFLAAKNGVEAMDLIEQEKPDLIITDYMMPLWNGLEICRSVRVAPKLRHIRTILITGRLLPQELTDLVEQGVVDGTLAKPFLAIEVSHLVRRLLEEGPRPPRKSARAPLEVRSAGDTDENFYLAIPRDAWEMPCAFCGGFVRKRDKGLTIEKAESFCKAPRLDFLRVWHDGCYKQYLNFRKD